METIFNFSDTFTPHIAKVNIYVYLKFEDIIMARTSFLKSFFLSFSLNPSILKTVRGISLKICIQVGSDDPR